MNINILSSWKKHLGRGNDGSVDSGRVAELMKILEKEFEGSMGREEKKLLGAYLKRKKGKRWKASYADALLERFLIQKISPYSAKEAILTVRYLTGKKENIGKVLGSSPTVRLALLRAAAETLKHN